MMKTVYLRLALLPTIGLLAVAFLLAPQNAFASTTQSQRSSVPHGVYTQHVYPRLSLRGCDGQDGYNGNVEWVTVPNGDHIQTWGEVWDECGTTVQLYLSWYDPGHENYEAGSAQPYTTHGVNYSHSTKLNAGHIGVTLCAWWFGEWTCGSPYYV